MESNYWKYTHQFPYFVNNVPVPEEGQVNHRNFRASAQKSSRSCSRTVTPVL